MKLDLKKIKYSGLSPPQQENYNFHKLAAVLADFGFTSIRLTDDWNGADLIAVHVDGKTILQIQLKGRLTFNKVYCDRNLWIAFPNDGGWYIYPHDYLLDQILRETKAMSGTSSWEEKGGYSFPSISKQLTELLVPFRVSGDTSAGRPIPDKQE